MDYRVTPLDIAKYVVNLSHLYFIKSTKNTESTAKTRKNQKITNFPDI